jgi:hypothetical protein
MKGHLGRIYNLGASSKGFIAHAYTMLKAIATLRQSTSAWSRLRTRVFRQAWPPHLSLRCSSDPVPLPGSRADQDAKVEPMKPTVR